MRRLRNWMLIMGALAVSAAASDGSTGHAQPVADDQRVLAPGLYVFQSRLDRSTCGEDAETGYVTSYFAAIDGVPGHREMTMRLLNSTYWARWSLSVAPDGRVVGESHQEGVPEARRGVNRFEIRREDGRFVGRGSRSYFRRIEGQTRRCSIEFDALLRKLHD